MKSLEILDDIYLDLEDYLLYMEKDLQSRLKNEESEASIMEVNDSIKITQINIYDGLNKIKQDLEVLEMFNKLLGDMDIDIWESAISHKETAEITYYGTDFTLYPESRGVSIKELKILKQWLEENWNE